MRRATRTAMTPSVEPMEGRVLMAARVGQVVTPAITVDETTSGKLEINVLSTAGAHPFIPLLDIVPGSVRVNGTAFARSKVAADPVDENGDGITDAVISVTPRRGAMLPPVGSTVRISGLVRFRVLGRPVVWSGAAVVQPGGSGGIGTPVAAQAYIGTVGLTISSQQFLNLNVLVATPAGGTYGYTPGVGPLKLVAGQNARITSAPSTTSIPATCPALITSPCACRWGRPSRSTTLPTGSVCPAARSRSTR